MNYRRLGKTGMKVSEVSLGTWQVGGGWGASFDDKTAESIINRAIDQGINFIDTGRGYTHSEERIGLALKGRRDQVVLAFKSHGHTAAEIRSDLETSLQARFLIPMAISLAFGLMFSSFILLFLLPIMIRIVYDLRRWVGAVE